MTRGGTPRGRGWSIERKLPLAVTLLLTGLLGAYIWAAYREVDQTATDAAGQRLHYVGEELSTLLAASAVTRNATARRILSSPLLDPGLNGRVTSQVDSILAGLRTGADRSQLVMLLDSSERTVHAMGTAASALAPQELARAMRTFAADTASGTGRIFQDGNRAYSWQVHPIRRNGVLRGYAAHLRPVGTPGTSTATLNRLIGEQTTVLFANAGAPRTPWVRLDGELIEAPDDGGESFGAHRHTRAGVEYIADVLPIPQTPWVIVLETPYAITHARALHFLRRTGVLGALLILTGGILAWVVSRQFTRPMRELAVAADEIGAGHYERRIQPTRGDELGALALAFNHMAFEVQRAQERDRFLADASHVLSSSLDYDRTLQQLAELVVGPLGDWCILHVLAVRAGEQPLNRVHHAVLEKRELVQQVADKYVQDPENPNALTGQVLSTGNSLLLPTVTPELFDRTAPTEAEKRLLRGLGFASVLVVPLRVAGHTRGVITLVSATPDRRFDEADLRVAEELGRRAGVAVENARLYNAARLEIRDRVRAETQVRELNAELEDRVRQRTVELETVNRELEAFSYSVSHDLRSPLRSIDGFSQALLEDYAEKFDVTGLDYLRRVRAAAQRMAALIDDLLQLTRVSRKPMSVVDVDLSELAGTIVSELQQAQPERSVQVRIEPNLQASGDPGLLRVLLTNLLSNAWKFTARRADPVIEFGANRENGATAFFLRDNGIGFDMKYAAKLFGAFQRLHSSEDFDGTGIGLATVQRVVTRHGGRVWADAAVDRGATFYFTL